MRPDGKIVAPGKVMLVGEYAVLEGSKAVVMAVDRHVVLYPSKSPAVGLVAFARQKASVALGSCPDSSAYEADSSDFYEGNAKLGLGSSAAVTVASVASVFWESGRNLADSDVKRQVFEIAYEVHNAFQGEKGSGADVAASSFGGTLVVESGNPIGPWSAPAPIRWVFLWSGREASTPALIQAVRQFGKRAKGQYTSLTNQMAQVAQAFASASNISEILASVATYGALMAELGRAAGVDLVTEEMARVMELARHSGGAAKPSGAGGGDIMVAAFEPEADVGPFIAQAKGMGMVPLVLAQDTCGVHSLERGGT